MARLPDPGSDIDTWGEILNEYLLVSHTTDGYINPSAVGTSQLQNQSVTADKIADGSITSSKLATGLLSSGSTVTQTRIAPFQFDHTGNVVTFSSKIALTLRQPFMLPLSAKRFRIHTRNRNFLNDTDAKAVLSNYQIWIGEHLISGPKGHTSAFKAAPYKIVSGVTLTNGTEHITSWVDTTKVKIDANKPMLLSRSYSIPAGAQVSTGGGTHFVAYTDSVVGQTAAIAADSTPNQNFLDTWIEYEYEDRGQPVMMVVSNSLSSPGNVNNVYQRGESSTWHQQWAMANGGVVASIAVAGSWAAHYTATTAKWTHYATASSQINPDVIVFMGLGSSDVAGSDGSSASLETAKRSLGTAIEKARSLWPYARIIVTTNPPRNNSGAIESARLQFNSWIANSPYGAEQCIDIDRVLRNPSSQEQLHPELDSTDNNHWNERGHAVVSQLIPSHSRR